VFAEPLSDLIAVSQGFIKDHINHQSRRLWGVFGDSMHFYVSSFGAP
jgi:hypothetical protein